jgi:hypothetical protein
MPPVADTYSSLGVDLRYGFTIARAKDPTKSVQLPVVPSALTITDRWIESTNANLAGDSRAGFIKCAIDAEATWQAINRDQRDLLRGLFAHGSDIYLLTLERSFRLRAHDSIHYIDSVDPTKHYGNLIHSSATLASKYAVAAGGTSLIAKVSAFNTWANAIVDVFPRPVGDTEFAGTYEDANERVVLNNVLSRPAVGAQVFIRYDVLGFAARIPSPLQMQVIAGRSDLTNCRIKFEGA